MKTKTPDLLRPEEIKKNLKTKIVGSEILYYEKTTSTMDVARALIQTNFKNGTTIFTEEQSNGRGRSNHVWVCPKYKGLLLTILLKHTIKPDSLCLLIGTIAVAITEMVRESCQLQAEIKWPNDILISGKKLGGILVTIEKNHNRQPVFLIGIGININNSEREFPNNLHIPPTSIAIEKKEYIDRILFARTLLQYLDKWYLILRDEHFKYIIGKWKEYCITIGKELIIADYGKEYSGRVIGISYNGGLMLKLNNGSTKIFRGEHATIKSERCIL
ncbi:MAG: biotin--[acetyl-CoA-carboxylase] ligase [Candidatus Kuenenia sp.]|nr:biotin--[acetyl-CoA-carboxylase] ligase [Candidatus Kuenenia hertensis]